MFFIQFNSKSSPDRIVGSLKLRHTIKRPYSRYYKIVQIEIKVDSTYSTLDRQQHLENKM